MVQTIADVGLSPVEALLGNYGLRLEIEADGAAITGSYWGDSEAGVIGHSVYVRRDTPVHSLLHETCHIICMSEERRKDLATDAGGDDLEEEAVCYLQVILSDELAGVGRDRLMADMDAWGYSFRLGDTRSWFENDAQEARNWLIDKDLLGEDGRPMFKLRQ